MNTDSSTTRPNILLLMTDQQRYDSLGCCGAAFAHTPNLDRLAAEGAVFERCYANNPICTPSRASLMTGKHILDHGVHQLNDHLPGGEVLFPRRLQDLGYQTALFGKLHVSAAATEAHQRHPNDGFDIYALCNEGCMHMDAPYQAYAHWLRDVDPDFYARLRSQGRDLTHPPRERHLSYWAAERALAFLERERDPARPFFCMMSLFDPHNPYAHYPKEMASRVSAALVPPPVTAGDGPEPDAVTRERHHNYLQDMATMSPEAIAEMRHGYHASVSYADLEFGRVLDRLDALGLREKTLVIMTSDHGDMLGDHGLLVKGAYFFDPNVRVPLLMRWPGVIPAGRRVGGLAQLHDLAATVLSAAGLAESVREGWMPESRDLLPLARGEAVRVHEGAYCCYRNSGMAAGHRYWDPPLHGTMICDGRYKYSEWDSDSVGELYDLEADPLEQVNCWGDPGWERVQGRLRGQLEGWLAGRGEG